MVLVPWIGGISVDGENQVELGCVWESRNQIWHQWESF